MLSWRSWPSSSTARGYYGRGLRLQLPPVRLRGCCDGGSSHDRDDRLPVVARRRVAAIVYRAVVSSPLTGLDTVPKNDAARLLTIFQVLAGMTIFAYIGS